MKTIRHPEKTPSEYDALRGLDRDPSSLMPFGSDPELA